MKRPGSVASAAGLKESSDEWILSRIAGKTIPSISTHARSYWPWGSATPPEPTALATGE